MAKNSKKSDKTQVNTTGINLESPSTETGIKRGQDTKDIIAKLAPMGIEMGFPDYIKIDGKYARTWTIERIPNEVYIGWLRSVYESNYDTDISVYMDPAEAGKIRKTLLERRTTIKAEMEMDASADRTNDLDTLQHKYDDVNDQIQRIERGGEVGYLVRFLITLYSSGEDITLLDKQSRELENKFSSQGIGIRRLTLQQYQAWLSNLPFGRDHIESNKRNFSAGASMASFPFYSADKSDKGGVFIGNNSFTGRPITLNLYDRGSGASNSNVNIFGAAGKGKTFLVSLLTLRSALTGIRTLIIDPEGEYRAIADAVHGDTIRVSLDQGQSQLMNIFDVEEEKVTDTYGNETERFSLSEKIADIVNFINVADSDVTNEQSAAISAVVKELYESKFGIIDGKPDSLYHHDDQQLDASTHKIVMHRYKKRMPKLSDLLDLIHVHVLDGDNPELQPVLTVMNQYKQGGAMGAFDTYTPESLKNLKDSLVVDMDVSQIEDNKLRALALYVVLSWAWEKFGKKHPERRKRIAVDEAWMFTSHTFPGSAYTGAFLENVARRFRKRNGGLLVATQNVDEFVNDAHGQQVLKNAATTFLFGQTSAGMEALDTAFKVDSGIFSFVRDSTPGQFVLMQGMQNFVGTVNAFAWEENLILKSSVGQGAASTDSTRNKNNL